MTDGPAVPPVPTGASLWDFAGALYRRPGVEAACLTLQDEHGIDVPLALWSLWVGLGTGELADPVLEEAVALVAPWRGNVVEPLRAVRRWLRSADAAAARWLRKTVAAVELDAERLQLDALEAFTGGLTGQPTVGPAGPAAAGANLVRLLAAAGVAPADALGCVEVLRAAVG